MSEEEKNKLLEWERILRNISQFVTIEKVKGIKFEIRTNEQSGHHRPHLHVSTNNASLSIAIDNGEILAQSGTISPPQLKMAKKWITENHDLIVKCWDDFSNGIEIPVS